MREGNCPTGFGTSRTPLYDISGHPAGAAEPVHDAEAPEHAQHALRSGRTTPSSTSRRNAASSGPWVRGFEEAAALERLPRTRGPTAAGLYVDGFLSDEALEGSRVGLDGGLVRREAGLLGAYFTTASAPKCCSRSSRSCGSPCRTSSAAWKSTSELGYVDGRARDFHAGHRRLNLKRPGPTSTTATTKHGHRRARRPSGRQRQFWSA